MSIIVRLLQTCAIAKRRVHAMLQAMVLSLHIFLDYMDYVSRMSVPGRLPKYEEARP